MIARRYCISSGVGVSKNGLPSFDKALIEAGVGNYNLVRLSSILPAECEQVDVLSLPDCLQEGSLLPTAYATITSDTEGDTIISTIGVGIPVDKSKVGVIMEYSAKNIEKDNALRILHDMIQEAFDVRGWELESVVYDYATVRVDEGGTKYTTFACIAEWE